MEQCSEEHELVNPTVNVVQLFITLPQKGTNRTILNPEQHHNRSLGDAHKACPRNVVDRTRKQEHRDDDGTKVKHKHGVLSNRVSIVASRRELRHRMEQSSK